MLLLNDKQLDVVVYPNNESLLRPHHSSRVTLRYESDADLFRLQVLAAHWGRLLTSRTTLVIPYMPYSRADRSENGSVFTLRHVAEFIARCGFGRIHLYEPHSDVTEQELVKALGGPNHLCRVKVHEVTKLVALKAMKYMDFQPHDWIVFPDSGAGKRYFGFSDAHPVLFGIKNRDFDTGKIGDVQFPEVIPALGSRALIVDDLCSRGGTFTQAAKRLRDMGFAEVHLAVTHVEPAGYNTEMTLSLDHIYHTDTIAPPCVGPNYTVFPLKGFYPDAS